jgi:hypothetical protein
MCCGKALALVRVLNQRRLAQAVPSTDAPEAGPMMIAFLVSSFLGSCPVPQSFKLSPGCLARYGFKRRRHAKKTYGAPRTAATKEEWAYRGIQAHGRAAALLWPEDLFGRLVYVDSSQAELDASAVSASVDSSPYFSRDGPCSSSAALRNRNAWHAVKVHNFCRPMGASEACCERVGSLMQDNWDKRKGEDAGALMDSVLLQEARVSGIGNPRDELICKEVAAAFLTLGKNPVTTGRRASKPGDSRSKVLARVRVVDQARLAESGRGSMGNPVEMLWQDRKYEADDLPPGANAVLTRGLIPRSLTTARAERRRRATPALKPSTVVQQALQSAKTDTGVAALPMFLQKPRKERGQAGSVRKEKLSHWLQSEEGLQWRREKKQLFEDAE